MINVYRALTGSQSRDIYSGVSIEQLDAKGICTSNNSRAQAIGRMVDIDVGLRHVPGLPVFLDRSQAEDWLRPHRYRSSTGAGGLAVLACAEVPTEAIADGKIQIVRTTLDPSDPFGEDDQALSLSELEAHQRGDITIRDECYIPYGQVKPDTLATTFLVARAYSPDGRIDFSLSPAFVDLAELR